MLGFLLKWYYVVILYTKTHDTHIKNEEETQIMILI